MIVEESPFLRVGLNTIFKRGGKWGEILLAQNGFEALDILQFIKPDMICIGENLPIMDSETLIREIFRLKKLQLLPCRTTIVMMSEKCRDQLEDQDLVDCKDCLTIVDRPENEPDLAASSIRILERKLLSLTAS